MGAGGGLTVKVQVIAPGSVPAAIPPAPMFVRPGSASATGASDFTAASWSFLGLGGRRSAFLGGGVSTGLGGSGGLSSGFGSGGTTSGSLTTSGSTLAISTGLGLTHTTSSGTSSSFTGQRGVSSVIRTVRGPSFHDRRSPRGTELGWNVATNSASG